VDQTKRQFWISVTASILGSAIWDGCKRWMGESVIGLSRFFASFSLLWIAVLIFALAWLVQDYWSVRRYVRRHRYPPFWQWLETDDGKPYKAAAEYSVDGLMGAWEDWVLWKKRQNEKTRGATS
jgi:hypothetical protein